MQKSLLVASVFALSLTACSQEKTADATTTAADTPAATPAAAPAPAAPAADASAGVERNETVAAAPAAAALSVQPGPDGMQVALTKARVTGDILTVELQYSLPPASDDRFKSANAPLDQITYIDDATSRKYDVLKDQAGNYMAVPLGYNKKQISIMARDSGPGITSIKFPAPPATSPTISLSIPEVGSFDAIAVQR